MVPGGDSLKTPDPKSEEGAVYPFGVDVPAEPERKYLFSIYKIAKISTALMFASMVVCAMLVWSAKSRRTEPYAIYWDAKDERFFTQPASRDSTDLAVPIDERSYIGEYFIREYVKRVFGDPTDLNWCNCRDIGYRRGFFTGGEECFVCNFTEDGLYGEMTTNIRPGFAEAVAGDVVIKDVFRRGAVLQTAKGNLVLETLGLQKFARWIIEELRVDFTAGGVDYIGYFTMRTPEENPKYDFMVSGASFVFDPKGGAR